MNHINQIIEKLGLEKHPEGGYFKETFRSDISANNPEGNSRAFMTSIYYLLTRDAHLSYFAVNKSDLILYHHQGDPLKIIFIAENGDVTEEMLGSDIAAGHKPQLICPGNVCKAYDLMQGEYALIGEAVSPGFDFADMRMPNKKEIEARAPDKVDMLAKFICPT